jgi:hypothetical protein
VKAKLAQDMFAQSHPTRLLPVDLQEVDLVVVPKEGLHVPDVTKIVLVDTVLSVGGLIECDLPGQDTFPDDRCVQLAVLQRPLESLPDPRCMTVDTRAASAWPSRCSCDF